MSETPPRVTDNLFARLLEQLGAPAMVELTAWVAFANMAARSNIAMGISAQGFSKECPLPLAQPSARALGRTERALEIACTDSDKGAR
jgi:hypothetical protein